MKITTAPSQPTTERLTQQSIIRRFLRETEAGIYGTATSGAADKSYFNDTTLLKSGQLVPEDYEKCWVRIDTTTDGNAPQGEIRPITRYDPDLGRITVAPTFSAAVESGDTYQIVRWPHPQLLIDHINTILTEECWLSTLAICTEVPDGDMERSVDTEWTGVNATVAKATAEPKMNGRRYLSVLDSGSGGGYAKPAGQIFVEPGEGFHLSACVRCGGSATAKLALYDVTNSRTISSIEVTRKQMVRPYIDVTIPQDCYEVMIQLTTVTASGTTYWDDVAFFPLAASSIALPNYIEDKSQVKAVYRLIPNEVNQSNVWSADYELSPEHGWDVYLDDFSGHNRLRTRLTATNLPLVIECVRKEEAFSSPASDYKAINGNWFNAELCVKVFEAMSSWPGAGSIDSKWVERRLADFMKKRDQQRYAMALNTRTDRQRAISGVVYVA